MTISSLNASVSPSIFRSLYEVRTKLPAAESWFCEKLSLQSEEDERFFRPHPQSSSFNSISLLKSNLEPAVSVSRWSLSTMKVSDFRYWSVVLRGVELFLVAIYFGLIVFRLSKNGTFFDLLKEFSASFADGFRSGIWNGEIVAMRREMSC